jgi:CRISPR type III-B/RAMP module-associated protein Cmr3
MLAFLQENKGMVEYLAQPYDVLYFRGNKSFYFGEWYSEGVFPPLPTTFQGFVRTKILMDNDLLDSAGYATDRSKVKKLVGDDSTLAFEITGPFLCHRDSGQIYFQTPKDMFRKYAGSHWTVCSVMMDSVQGTLHSDLEFDLACLNVPNEKPEKIQPPPYVSLEELARYRLQMELPMEEKDDLLFTEDRVGIGLDRNKAREKSRAVEDGKFFVTPYCRLNDQIGFYFTVSGTGKIKFGALKLGSESHLAKVQAIATIEQDRLERELKRTREDLVGAIQRTRTFRLILLQPGIFTSGWKPFETNPNSNPLTAEVLGVRLQLLGACVGDPITISGYSYERNVGTTKQKEVRLKPAVCAVPAGSVYLFKIDGSVTMEQIKNLVEALDNKKIEYKPYSQMGFNHTIIACGPML